MTGFDIAVILLVGTGAAAGFFRGFVQEILALGAWIFAIFAIRYMHTPLTAFLEPEIGTPSGASVLAFAILLLVPYAFVKLVARKIGEASRNSVLGPIDRVLGFGFGAVKGLILATLAYLLITMLHDIVWPGEGQPQWVTDSRTFPLLNASGTALVDLYDYQQSLGDE